MSTPAKTSANRNIGTYALTFDHDEVVQLLRAAVEREGNQGAFARRHGIGRPRLSATSPFIPQVLKVFWRGCAVGSRNIEFRSSAVGGRP